MNTHMNVRKPDKMLWMNEFTARKPMLKTQGLRDPGSHIENANHEVVRCKRQLKSLIMGEVKLIKLQINIYLIIKIFSYYDVIFFAVLQL